MDGSFAASPNLLSHCPHSAPLHASLLVLALQPALAAQEAFGTTDEDKICLEILAKGELQVSRGAGVLLRLGAGGRSCSFV